MDESAKLLAIVAVAAFTTERILAAVNYLMNAFRLSRIRSGLGVQLRKRERRQLLLTAIAAVIGYFVVDRANIRLLRVLQVGNVPAFVDFWLTWLVVVAGADRVHSMLAGGGGGGGSSSDRAETPVIRFEVDEGVRVLRVS